MHRNEVPKQSNMAELKNSVSEDSLPETDLQETYSFTECQQIGKDFLQELKLSLRASTQSEIEEPRAKATKYLEKTEVLQLLEDLIAKLVFMRPEKPIDFLVNEMEELKRKGMPKNNEDKAS